MVLNTCGGCPDVKIHINKAPWFAMAYCGKTGGIKDGIIVPHEYDGEKKTITYTRVPDFCKNPDAEPSEKPAPIKDWVTVNLK